MATTVCYFLIYMHSTICYTQQPVPNIPPVTLAEPAPAPSQGSAFIPQLPTLGSLPGVRQLFPDDNGDDE